MMGCTQHAKNHDIAHPQIIQLKVLWQPKAWGQTMTNLNYQATTGFTKGPSAKRLMLLVRKGSHWLGPWPNVPWCFSRPCGGRSEAVVPRCLQRPGASAQGDLFDDHRSHCQKEFRTWLLSSLVPYSNDPPWHVDVCRITIIWDSESMGILTPMKMGGWPCLMRILGASKSLRSVGRKGLHSKTSAHARVIPFRR